MAPRASRPDHSTLSDFEVLIGHSGATTLSMSQAACVNSASSALLPAWELGCSRVSRGEGGRAGPCASLAVF